MNYEDYFRRQLDGLRREGRYRVFADLERKVGAFPKATHHASSGPSEVTVWCSNDYLGLTGHPLLRKAACEAMDRYGFGAGASRLISGTSALHQELEQRLAQFKGTEAALVFNSGYAANTGIIPAVAGDGEVAAGGNGRDSERAGPGVGEDGCLCAA